MKRSKKKRIWRTKKLLNRIEKHIITQFEVNADGVSTSELVNLILDFCEVYSGRVLYKYQEQFSKRIIRSVLENDGEELTALFARQMGKTETVSITVGGLMIMLPRLANMPMFATDRRLQMFKDGFWVGVFAPSLRQAQTCYNRMRGFLQSDTAIAILQDPDFGYDFSTSNGQTVALTNGSFATAVSASEGSNIEGDSYKLIICEECQDISSFKIRKSIHPMGSAYGATLVKIGTATTFKGDFYEAIQRNKRDFSTGRLKIRNHFEYDYTVGIKYNERYAKSVAKEKYRLGEHSDEFRMSYKLEWILERGMFVDPIKLEQLNGNNSLGRRIDNRPTCVVGIDLAKKDDDTVITPVEVDWEHPVIVEKNKNDSSGMEEDYKAYNTCIMDWKEINGDNYDSQYYIILDYLSKFNLKRVMIDATKEEGMADRLRANMQGVDVVACIFSAGFKSAMYKHLDSEIKTGRATFPMDEETKTTREYQKFLLQMGELQKEWRGQVLHVSHPPERGAHDDYPDSWALAVYGTREQCDIVKIEAKNSNVFYKPTKTRNVFYKNRNNLTARRR